MSDLEIRAIGDDDVEAVAALWKTCNLTVSYNDPHEDIQRCRRSPASELFVGIREGRVVATVMAGEEGHRGWLYYVAVDPAEQKHGHGRAMIHHAEMWLMSRGMPKVMLMIRDTNVAVEAFYHRLGYRTIPRLVLQKVL